MLFKDGGNLLQKHSKLDNWFIIEGEKSPQKCPIIHGQPQKKQKGANVKLFSSVSLLNLHNEFKAEGKIEGNEKGGLPIPTNCWWWRNKIKMWAFQFNIKSSKKIYIKDW